MMTIFDLINRFLAERDYEPFSTAENALYFALLIKANSRRWQMPIKYPTSMLQRDIKVSKQTLVIAREKLSQRGLIEYVPGRGKAEAPNYTLIGLTDDLTDRLTNAETYKLTDRLTDNLTIYKNKEEDKDYSYNKHVREEKVSIDELEDRLTADEVWLSSILSLLSASQTPLTNEGLSEYLAEFFATQRAKGVEDREEKECKAHFINWLKLQIRNKNNGYGIYKRTDKRGTLDVTAKSAKDYEGAF